MNNFFDGFLFGGNSKNSYKINRNWNGLLIFYRLLSLVLGRFDYKNLPETMDKRYLEMCLIFDGQAGIIKKDGDLINLSISGGNQFSRYGYLQNCDLLDYMGKYYGRYIPSTPGNENIADCSIVFDSLRDLPPFFRIRWYANTLCDLQTSINIAIKNTRASVMVQCSKEQEQTIKKAFKASDEGLPVIWALDSADIMSLKPEVIMNAQTPEILKTLIETRDKFLCDFCTEFGINANAVQNKLSGVSNTELEQNDQMIKIALNNALDMRKKGFKNVNKLFGTNIIPVIANDFNEEENCDIINNKEEQQNEDISENS